MNIQYWCVRIATLGPIGYSLASGTVATLVTIPFVYLLHAYVPNQWQYLGVLISLFFVGVGIVAKALTILRHSDDPSEIVLDEFVACLLVFWGIALSASSIVVGFLMFRALDVIKVGIIKKAEDLVGAWGVMGDDIIAALLTNIALRFLF